MRKNLCAIPIALIVPIAPIAPIAPIVLIGLIGLIGLIAPRALPAQSIEDLACIDAVPVLKPPPVLTPWVYRSDGGYVWGAHQFWEDPGNAVFSLARELVEVPPENLPPGPRPDVLLFNFAQFDPPEGEPVPAGGTRRIIRESVERKGLQLLVNYGGAVIDAAFPSVRYMEPTFFQSIDGHFQNTQTTPPVPWAGVSFETLSATRGAFGCAFAAIPPHTIGRCKDFYVTAGLGYGLSDLDPDPVEQALAALARTDRLMRYDVSSGQWQDAAQDSCPGGARIPASAASGNSSVVAFADLTGDGWSDLYIGKPGDRYLGAPNVLLVNDGTGCFTDETATRIPGEPSRATNDVAAADLDGDGDLDLVVANRCRQSGACGTESEDYVLVNNGSGFFSVPVWLNAGMATDTRSVAVGQLDSPVTAPDLYPEIVLGNAGSDGFGNTLQLSAAQNHRMQIFRNQGATGGPVNTFVDKMDPWLDPNAAGGYPTEHEVTAPLTFQVLLADLFHPAGTNDHTRDGWLDLIIVGHREILKNDAPLLPASRVYVMANQANWAGPAPYLIPYAAFPSPWLRTVALADFTGDGFVDLFEGRGSRFAGVLADVHKNLGNATTSPNPWDFSGGFIGEKSYEAMPATEHGYGFDFGDANGDGALDALQTSRGYDYFAFGLNTPGAVHRDLATTGPGTGTGKTSNKRGRQVPQGMEDGVFADFDRDGDLDALMASQRTPAMPLCTDTSPDSMVLVNAGSGTFGYDAVYNAAACSTEDARIDLVNRVTHPGIADRAVAGDLDSDGDLDAIVHLFEIFPPAGSGPTPPVTAANGFPNPIDTYSFGWRYLQNVIGTPGAGSFWFRDVAPVKMKNASGAYDPTWNRSLGMDVLADFDNNGALDLYTTVGFAQQQSVQYIHPNQVNDLLFLNGVGGQPKGTLVESSNAYLPPPCSDVVQETVGDLAYTSCGSFGLAQGDVDNDGDADAVVTHYSQSGRTNYPWLLINRLSQPGVNALVDELATRLPIGSFSSIIHTADQDLNGSPTVDMDHAMFPVLFDLDGDGDLDLAWQVVDDLPRVFLNTGTDSNNDGLINAADSPPPGTFTDVTATTLRYLQPSTDAQDIAAVDVDGDGDHDLAIDPFTDRVHFWRNDRLADGGRPAVTEIWPRVGSIRRQKIRLTGVNLDNVVKVQLRFAGGALCEQTVLTPVGTAGTQLDMVIPWFCPLGLAQIRVLRSAPACGGTSTTQIWSRQYFGYFVLG